MHNVLRDLQESPLGAKANQLESMTIELVAMLFDFIFETKDLPDSIKALIGRLQIPVLKAAMLDGAFFSKKSHPSRLLVNALAQAGIGWSPTMGHDDPLYRKIESIVHRILDEFTDDLGALRRAARGARDVPRRGREGRPRRNIQSTAEEINQRDRQEIAQSVAHAEIERRLETASDAEFPGRRSCASSGSATLTQRYLRDGEEERRLDVGAHRRSTIWSGACSRSATTEDRKQLVAMLPTC